MAEEKSAPKKAPKKEAKPVEAAAAEETKAVKAPAAADKAAAPAAEAAPAEAPKAATAADLLKDEVTALKVRKAKGAKNITTGIAFVTASFNNTIVSITDPSGAVISWASSGGVGFKGSRKSTPYAAGMAAESAARQAAEHGVKKVDVFVKGPGSGRETAIRSLQAAGLEVGSIQDVTPQAHNGCRPPKRRRV